MEVGLVAGADYIPLRPQPGRVPLDEDASREREMRQRERAISGADYDPLAPQGFAKVGRVVVAAVLALAALALGALLLSQIQGPRDLRSAGSIDRDKLVGAGRTTPQEVGTATASTATGEPESTPLPPTAT